MRAHSCDTPSPRDSLATASRARLPSMRPDRTGWPGSTDAHQQPERPRVQLDPGLGWTPARRTTVARLFNVVASLGEPVQPSPRGSRGPRGRAPRPHPEPLAAAGSHRGCRGRRQPPDRPEPRVEAVARPRAAGPQPHRARRAGREPRRARRDRDPSRDDPRQPSARGARRPAWRDRSPRHRGPPNGGRHRGCGAGSARSGGLARPRRSGARELRS